MAKKLKIKLPKRIGGVKIPKSVRKGPVGSFINSGAGQVLIGEALLFAAGAIGAKKADDGSTFGEVLHHPSRGLKAARDSARHITADKRRALKHDSAKLQFAMREAARAFQAAMDSDHTEDHYEDEPDVVSTAGGPAGAQQGEPTKKKTSRGVQSDPSATPH